MATISNSEQPWTDDKILKADLASLFIQWITMLVNGTVKLGFLIYQPSDRQHLHLVALDNNDESNLPYVLAYANAREGGAREVVRIDALGKSWCWGKHDAIVSGTAPAVKSAKKSAATGAAKVRRSTLPATVKSDLAAMVARRDAAAVEPAAVEPAAVEPAAVEPAAVEPAAVEPAAVKTPAKPTPDATPTPKPRHVPQPSLAERRAKGEKIGK